MIPPPAARLLGKAATAYGFVLRLVACGLYDFAADLVEMTADPESSKKWKR
jgi:hypothetical protein